MGDDAGRNWRIGWSPRYLAREARRIARDAHEDSFDRHWGFGVLGDGALVYMFDNHPSRDPTLRGRLHAELIRRAAERGIAVAAQASYPPSGESQGYTVAIVFDASDYDDDLDDAVPWLDAIWGEVFVASVTRCKWTPTGRALKSV
jgi:hypothetical protein